MSFEPFALLNEGAAAWNRWRADNPCQAIDLPKTNLSGRDLTGADLRQVNLRGAVLRSAILKDSLLGSANLSGADLSGAVLDCADLTSTDARGAYFIYATARSARLRKINLNGANLTGADLQGADLESAILLETVLVDCNLRGAAGLDQCDQPGPSIIDFRTFLRSGGLPLVFLRGCGLPDELIESYSSLNRASASCFLSYSTKDEEFARKLYSSLQARGVRCWFAPEDLPIGVKIRPAIDRQIFGRDRFVIVLSANSIDSPWVEKEVETAFERAYKQNSAFFVPLRLDDAVLTTGQAWAADLRRSLNIGDFRSWQDPAKYERALDRLLRDLRSPDPAA